MAVSFPGMNPYLEHPDRWSTVHNRLIVAIADILTPQLLPKYQVDIEKRIYEILNADLSLIGRSDVSVQDRRESQSSLPNRLTSTLPTAQPLQVSVPMIEEIRETYLEVREIATRRVITTIEILSPSNKKGQGRQRYEEKRQRVFTSQTHLIEIDLLREGSPLPVFGTSVQSHYRILVSRANQRPIADLYLFNVADAIPVFSLPLQAEDPEPLIDLKLLLDDVYVRSGYDFFIDYSIDPIPELASAESSWLDSLLKQNGVRTI
jgi:hypothetical protein